MNKEEVQNLIKELVEKLTITINTIQVTEDKGNTTWFSLEVNEPHFFLNKEGEALHALSHVVRRIIENKDMAGVQEESDGEKKKGSILIDINDFQKKRVEAIRAIAHMMGERARYFKSNIEVDPMSAFERRIVHEFLADTVDLKTESAGFGPSRRVVIKYIGEI